MNTTGDRQGLRGGRWTAFLGAALVLLLVLSFPRMLYAQVPPSAGVFQLVVMTRTGGTRTEYHAVSAGTAFFIAADGRALTNSHVVYRARLDPVAFRLIAIVNQEFCGVTIISASVLPYDPTRIGAEGVSKCLDVAEIQLTRAQTAFDRLTFQNGASVNAHRARFPRFRRLGLGPLPVWATTSPSSGLGVPMLRFRISGRRKGRLPN